MIKIVMLATAMTGIVFFPVGPTMATGSTPSWIEQSLGSIEEHSATVAIEQVNELSFHSHRYYVQRPSSKPPGESRSGRISSSPAGKIAESGRESGRNLDPSEPPSPHEYDITSEQKPQKPMVTPKKDGDPLEGERQSQPPFKRRGGVVE